MNRWGFEGRFIASVLILGLSGCAAGFPPPLTMPELETRAERVKVSGFQLAGEPQVSQMIAKPKTGGVGFEVEAMEMGKTQADLITRLEKGKVADYFVVDGAADYSVVGSKVTSKGGVHSVTEIFLIGGYFSLGVLWLFPWGDAAHASVTAKVYDHDGKLIETVEEADGIVYGNWIIGVLMNTDRKRAAQIREAVLERTAVRVAEVIQHHHARGH